MLFSLTFPIHCLTFAIAGQAPAKPEKLLEAHELVPVSGKRNPRSVTVKWASVINVSVYRLEVCRDRRCNQPVLNTRDISDTEYTLTKLPVGVAYWSVTAVSKSGLDGFTSSAGVLNTVGPPKVPEPNLFSNLLRLVAAMFVLMMVVLLLKTVREDDQ